MDDRPQAVAHRFPVVAENRLGMGDDLRSGALADEQLLVLRFAFEAVLNVFLATAD
jgi:hypothetical protein